MTKQLDKQPTGWGKLIASVLLSAAALGVQVVAMLAILVPRMFSGSLGSIDLATIAVGEVAGGVAALLFVVLLGGKRLVRLRAEGAGFALKAACAVIITNSVLAVLSVWGSYITGEAPPVDPNWLVNVLLLIPLCLGVGMFEEGVFRGLIFQGLLARMGKTTVGVVAAVVVSSFLFGCVHVFPLDQDSFSAMGLAQTCLKLLQTGIFGAVLAVVVLKTDNLWLAVLIHAFCDFVLLLFANGVWGTEFQTDYVLSPEEAGAVIFTYLFVIACYLPSLVMSLTALRQGLKANRGAFYKTRQWADPALQAPYSTCDASSSQVNPQPFKDAGLPVPPVGDYIPPRD